MIIRRTLRPTLGLSIEAVIGVCVVVVALFARGARADDSSLEGSWGMSPLTETFVVQQWGGSCGPAPVSTTQPGGLVTVHSDGGELVIEPSDARRRRLRTDQCIDPLPTLARETHSADGRAWRTRCTTPPSDPRHAVINSAYFLSSASDALSIAETGQYEFTIAGSRCVANVTREATIRRVQAVAPAASAAPAAASATATAPTRIAAPTPAPDPDSAPCASPGEPARLEVRPSRKLLRLGDNYRFRAIVVDDAGCPTGTSIQWSIAALRSSDGRDHIAKPSVDGAGRLTIPPDTTDAQFDVVATAAGHSARAVVEVTSDANYEALLARSGLDSNGERGDPAVTSLATASIGGSSARAEDGAARRRTLFVSIIAVLVAALGVVAVVGTLRARRARAVEQAAQARHADKMREYEREKREREEVHAAQLRAHLESVAHAKKVGSSAVGVGGAIRGGALFCPSCHREFNDGTAYCPFDANRLVTVAGHEAIIAGPVGGVCPTCHRGFNPGVRACPHDGDELVPPAMATARPVATRGKICPTCGGRFEGSAAFCGKDGTMLVLLN